MSRLTDEKNKKMYEAEETGVDLSNIENEQIPTVKAEIKEAEIIDEDEDLEETLFKSKKSNNPFEE